MAEPFTAEDWTFGRGGVAPVPAGPAYPPATALGGRIAAAAVRSETRVF